MLLTWPVIGRARPHVAASGCTNDAACVRLSVLYAIALPQLLQLCDEDIEFLATLSLPRPLEPVRPHVAIMVDTSWRPKLQHYVVHNVHNHTGWPIQLFHGPSNGPKVRARASHVQRLARADADSLRPRRCTKSAYE